MKKNFAIALFVLLTTFGVHTHTSWTWNELVRDNFEMVKVAVNWKTTIRLPDENKTKLSKRDLKDEIKRRKKHHKALVSIYNESFQEEYLDLIADNSKKLSYLRALLES